MYSIVTDLGDVILYISYKYCKIKSSPYQPHRERVGEPLGQYDACPVDVIPRGNMCLNL